MTTKHPMRAVWEQSCTRLRPNKAVASITRFDQTAANRRPISQCAWLWSALLATLLLNGCGQPELQPLIFGPVPWQDGEVSQYQITDVNGQSAGVARYAITQGAGDDQPAGWSIRREIDAQGATEVVTVAIDPLLLPLRSALVRGQAVNARQEMMTTTFDVGQVDMELTTAQNVTTYQRASIPSDARSGDVLLTIVRALPLEAGFATRLNAYLPIVGQLQTFVIHVVGSEQVTVPAGVYEAWKVELTTGNTTTTAWYSQDETHQLVKYVDGRNAGTFELTNFQPGE